MGRPKLNPGRLCKQCLKRFDLRQPDGRVNKRKLFCNKSCSMRYIALHRVHPKRTPEWKKKIGDAQRGKLGNNWRGGVTPWQKQERRRPEYITWRKAVFERDNYTCQQCGKVGGELNADHIKPWIAYPELRTELSNGRTLCVTCHRKTPTYARNLRYQVGV